MLQNIEWKEIFCAKESQEGPSMRWGHQFVCVGQQLVLYGGFGGDEKDSRYLDDLWVFNTVTMTWKLVETSGRKPDRRSNFSMSYDPSINSIIIFGGGGEGRKRTNSVNVLDWNSKCWTEYIPTQHEPAPWERTYHTANFIYPYLIAYGGESLSSMDLDDCWVFNIKTGKWREITIKEGSLGPGERRFHASVIVGQKMYVIGGCRANYVAVGDVFSLDLTPLIERDSVQLKWEFVCKNQKVQRWGHSASVIDRKIFIFAGRSDLDHNDLICISPDDNNQIERVPISMENQPKQRRRHSAEFVGGCLLILGGFNGKYLQDFHYLDLSAHRCITQSKVNPEKDLIRFIDIIQIQEDMEKLQSQLFKNIWMEVKCSKSVIKKWKVNKNNLQQHEYFKSLINWQSGNKIQMWLPFEFSFNHFRILVNYLLTSYLTLPNSFTLQDFIQLLVQSRYFCLIELSSYIQKLIVLKANEENWEMLLELSLLHELQSLQQKCLEIAIYQCKSMKQQKFQNLVQVKPQRQSDFNEKNQTEHEMHQSAQIFEDVFQRRKRSILIKAYQMTYFDIAQQDFKKNQVTYNGNIVKKAMKKIKDIICRPSPQLNQIQKSDQQRGFMHSIIDFILGLCRNPRVRHDEGESNR